MLQASSCTMLLHGLCAEGGVRRRRAAVPRLYFASASVRSIHSPPCSSSQTHQATRLFKISLVFLRSMTPLSSKDYLDKEPEAKENVRRYRQEGNNRGLALKTAIAISAAFALAHHYFPLNSSIHIKKHAPNSVMPGIKEDTAYGWKDDVWPIRPQQAWDISTDFSHPRKLKYEVEEGTWLRLDVSPEGEIVFDMLGSARSFSIPATQRHCSFIFDSLQVTFTVCQRTRCKLWKPPPHGERIRFCWVCHGIRILTSPLMGNTWSSVRMLGSELKIYGQCRGMVAKKRLCEHTDQRPPSISISRF